MTRRRPLIFELEGTPGFVDGSNFDDSDLETLNPSTVALKLERSQVTDVGVATLSRCRGLRCLDLDITAITDVALAHIAEIESLEELWLECTAVTDVGVDRLKQLRNLAFVSLAYTAASEQGVERLRRLVPGLEVVL